MKWLVQTLDSLSSHCSETQALTEQKKLESLISRYKNLIPSLEVTMVKTDTLSKCYTYKQDVKEVYTLLKRVQEMSHRKEEPHSLETVNELIKQQETAILQLDQHRAHVMTILQKGKELSKDANAPKFIEDEVKTLESGWSKTYDNTVEKLHTLVDTQQLWVSYAEQKQEIIELLFRAEQELKRIAPSQYSSSNLPAELLAKQEMAIRLRKATEEMLRKLRDLSQNLSKVAPVGEQTNLEHEFTEIERRLSTTLENVQERVVFLEQYNTNWVNFQNKFDELQSWTIQSAPQLLSAVQDQISPEERAIKTKILQSEVIQKINLIDQLNQDASTLMIEDNPNVKQLQAQVEELQNRVYTINQNVEGHAAAVTKDLKNWQSYRASIDEIKPIIEKSENVIQLGFIKPSSLQEALKMQAENKEFLKHCLAQQIELENISKISHSITSKTTAPDEIDVLVTRSTIVNDAAKQWDKKLEKLVATWQDFNKNHQNIYSWLEKNKKNYAESYVNLNTPQVDKLEKELARLKTFNNDLSEQQAKLIALTQSSDSLSHYVNPEGAVLVKNQIQELKSQISEISEGVRARINQVSDAILLNHDFQTKVGNFTHWINQLKASTAQIDQVSSDSIQSSLITIHDLIQEYSENQPVFNDIYSEIKNISLKVSPEEAQVINNDYSILAENYRDVNDKLQNKKAALEKWGDLLNFHGETSSQLSHVKYQLDSSNLTPEDLQELLKETNVIIQKVTHWKALAPSIDNMKDIIILDKQTGLPQNAEHSVRELEIRAINLHSQLADKRDSLEKLKEQWKQFEDLRNKVEKNLIKTENKIEIHLSKVQNAADLPNTIEALDHILIAHQEQIPIKEELRKETLLLMKNDIPNASSLQSIISTIETHWNTINEHIKEEKLKLSDTIFAWNDFKDAKKRIMEEIAKIQQISENLETPNDFIQANLNLEKTKKALDALKKCKLSLDKVDAKGQILMRKSEIVPGIEPEVRKEIQEVQQLWSTIYENLMKVSQTTESQATIWRHIEETKQNLLQWLSEQKKILALAIEKPNEVEAAKLKLARYNEELPAQQRLSQSIPVKYTQLVKLTNNKEIPTIQILVQLLEDQFKDLAISAQKLNTVACSYESKEKVIKDDIKNVGNKINQLREAVTKCEDLTGDNAKVLERLLLIRQLKSELLFIDNDLKNIEEKLQEMKAMYPFFSESSLPKEQQLLKKRFETIITHTNKIETALLNFLKKFYNEKYGALQRIISTHKEKVQWCLPESASDKYNLEVKLRSLAPIQAAIEDCENRRQELEQSLTLLEKIESIESFKLLQAEKEHLMLDFENLKESYSNVKTILEKNIALHDEYEVLSTSITNWLKHTENKVKNESSSQIDLDSLETKLTQTKQLQEEVANHENELNKLAPLSSELVKEMPESRVEQYGQHLVSRYQNISKFLISYLSKLHELSNYNDMYRKSVQEVENWLTDAEQKVEQFSDFTVKPNQATLNELKKFASEKERGQLLLSKAVEHGEALFTGVTPENRDSIRAELRNLRDKSEALIDKVNVIYKQVETILMQRHSFDDNLHQVKVWIEDAEAKLGTEIKLLPTLLEKKQTLHGYKTLAQDVNLHRNILKQLQEKIGQLSDAEAESKLDENLTNYSKLSQEVNNRIELLEEYIANHEAYNQAIEKCHDWLSALTSEAVLLLDESTTDSSEAKLAMVDNLLAQKTEGDKIIESCKQQLEVVLTQTAPAGHPSLKNAFEEQQKSWTQFLELCSSAKEKLLSIHSQYSKIEKIATGLETWLKQKEAQVKDQSLKSTEEKKRTHLDKLGVLQEEILDKEKDFIEVHELGSTVEGELNISQLLTRYQGLKNIVKEAITRYNIFVNDHKSFNDGYHDFVQWISDQNEELSNLSHIVGDLDILQDRQKDIQALIENRNLKSSDFDNLIEKGEKLYAHTSPDGREIIRQQLRNLRTIWDSFTDDLQNANNKLEQCLLQFSDFSSTQEQLTRWLKDVEKAMQQHTELKTTLQEKKAQLQNHKIMHQEIMSHQALVETVCDKAQHLVDQTQDKSLNVYLQSIKHLFLSIVNKSDELLKNLDECVEKHTEYTKLVASFKDWLSEQRNKLQEYNTITGEKSEIAKRVEYLRKFRDINGEEGSQLLENLKQHLVVVAKSTAPKGVELLKQEIENLYGDLSHHLSDIGKPKSSLIGLISIIPANKFII